MDYDFNGLCSDQLFELQKKLTNLNKTFIKEYNMALNVINSSEFSKHSDEVFIQIHDLLRDVVNKCEISYKQTFNKLQEVLRKHL